MRDELLLFKEYLMALFKEGWVLEDAERHYLETTWGIGEEREFLEALREGEIEEQLLDILLSPSTSLKATLHEILGNNSMSSKEMDLMAEEMASIPLGVVFSPGKKKVFLPLSYHKCLEFLQATGVSLAPIPEEVHSLLLASATSQYGRLLYLLKRGMFQWDKDMIGLFRIFFQKVNGQRLVPYLELILRVWDGKGGPFGLRLSLLKRHAQLEERLLHLHNIQADISSRGLEFVLCSRIPICAVPEHEREEEREMIGYLLNILFPFPLDLEDVF